jgi:two-component system, cell cycle sensor histidine kinase and response regulator CckA
LPAGGNGPAGALSAQLADRVSNAIGVAETFEVAVREAAACLVPDLADLTVIALQRDGLITRLEVAHVDPRLGSRAAALIRPLQSALERAALSDWQAGRHFRWISRVNPMSASFLPEPRLRQLIAELELHSIMVVPLRFGERVLGALGLGLHGERGRRFRAMDLAVAQVIARRAAAAIANAELQERSREEAERRNRLEDALQKWIQVFDLAGWGAAIVDGGNLRIEAVNPAFVRMHGYAASDQLSGRSFAELLAPECASEVARWSRDTGRLLEPYESVHLRADGASFPVLSDVTRMSSGPSSSYVVTVQDVSAMKRTEERLRRAQRMEAVGRLAGGVAHEVNNMMTIILGFSDLLAGAADLPEARNREVEEIRKAGSRTARVTQQLLAFSRQQILQPSDLELGEVVTEMSSVLGHLLPAYIRVEVAVSAVPVVVHADRAQLDQVLINLAFNARDAMPLGGTIRLSTDSSQFDAADVAGFTGIPIPPGRYAVLSVSDTGSGMDPATLSQIFEPFFTTKPVGSGTGLGLATVYGIVKQSGGFIWAESDPGKGTAFTVCLPRVATGVPSRPAPPENGSEEPVEPGATILIVEDEDGVRELARRVLEQQGYSVLEATNGTEAASIADTEAVEIDLVLSDVILPDFAPVELETRLTTRRPGLPILYMSGYSWNEVTDRELISERGRFIQKPFTAAELAHTVGRELRIAAARGRPVTT